MCDCLNLKPTSPYNQGIDQLIDGNVRGALGSFAEARQEVPAAKCKEVPEKFERDHRQTINGYVARCEWFSLICRYMRGQQVVQSELQFSLNYLTDGLIVPDLLKNDLGNRLLAVVMLFDDSPAGAIVTETLERTKAVTQQTTT